MGGGTCSGSNNGSSHGACLARQSLQARHPSRPCTAHRPHMLRARSCSNRCGRDGRAARNTAHHSWVWRAGAWLHNRMHQLVCAPQGTDHQTHTRALPPTGMMGSTAPDRMCSDWWRPPTVHSALGQVSPCTQCVSVYSCLWGGWKGGAQEDGAAEEAQGRGGPQSPVCACRPCTVGSFRAVPFQLPAPQQWLPCKWHQQQQQHLTRRSRPPAPSRPPPGGSPARHGGVGEGGGPPAGGVAGPPRHTPAATCRIQLAQNPGTFVRTQHHHHTFSFSSCSVMEPQSPLLGRCRESGGGEWEGEVGSELARRALI